MEIFTMSNFKHLLGPMRPPFLILTPACVLLGLGTAAWTSDQMSIPSIILVLIGATCAHISVNTFNEYFDYKSGLDSKTERTPFSGGSGTLPDKPELASQTLGIAIVTLVMTGLIGLYFLFSIGFSLLPIGALGLLVVAAYTPWITRRPILCLIAPGVGFGPLMVIGTNFVLTGQYSWTAFIASLVPFFLVNDLLLLNQFPDVVPDKSVGRKHFPMIAGRRISSLIYGAFLFLAFLSLAVGVNLGHLPKASLIGLIVVVIALPTIVGVYRYAEEMKKLIPFMGLNVMINIATPVLVAIGLFVG
jgi:1,4-dihydroxy-2-naphthoate octaprenyltransferase